jgi:hypothetical protein
MQENPTGRTTETTIYRKDPAWCRVFIAGECRLLAAISIFQIEGLLPRAKQTESNHFLCVDELPLPARSGHSGEKENPTLGRVF